VRRTLGPSSAQRSLPVVVNLTNPQIHPDLCSRVDTIATGSGAARAPALLTSVPSRRAVHEEICAALADADSGCHVGADPCVFQRATANNTLIDPQRGV
jgi:hypothetical protein